VHLERVAIGVAVLALATLGAGPTASASDIREIGRVTAKSAIVMDSVTGEVYFARDATTPLPPASTTKVLTALIALRTLSPDAPVSVSSYATTMPPSKAYLRPGWQLTARDLLYALLLRSANDAAVVIAEAVAGSVPGFAHQMNATARSVGATDSNFVTPNGLPAPNHYTTARDLALIFRAALQTPGMRDVLTTRTAAIQPLGLVHKRIPLRSTNRLLWRDDLNVIGKTGWTREAKRCFVGAASVDGREIIFAVLGSSDLWNDVETLASYGLEQVSLGGTWRDRSGWQQASAPQSLLGTPWSRPAEDEMVAEVAPPAGAIDMRRGMRMTARQAPTQRKASRGKTRGDLALLQAQGDALEARAGGMRYSIDVASYRSKARADQLRGQLAKRGYRAQVEPAADGYRVRLSGFASRDAAQKTARTLSRTMRLDPTVVASK